MSNWKSVLELRLWLQLAIAQMVERPQKVSVEAEETREGVVFRVDVSRIDLGRVIGEEGSNAKALRHVVKTIARHHCQRYRLDITSKEMEAGQKRIALARERKNREAASGDSQV